MLEKCGARDRTLGHIQQEIHSYSRTSSQAMPVSFRLLYRKTMSFIAEEGLDPERSLTSSSL